MSYREFHYRWEFDLDSSPEKLWPLVADTNRFNRDTGVPVVKAVSGKEEPLGNARRRLRLSVFGMAVEWEEQPFEWARPHRFGVVRRYTKGPIAELRMRADLISRDTSTDESSGDEVTDTTARTGTKLVYQVWARPGNLLGPI